MQNLIWCLQNLVSPFFSSASFSSSSLPNPLQDFCQRFKECAMRKINTTESKIFKKLNMENPAIWYEKSNISLNVKKRQRKERKEGGNWEHWWKTSCKCCLICFILWHQHKQAFWHTHVKLWHYTGASALLQSITQHKHKMTRFNSLEGHRKVWELRKVTSLETQ